MLGGGLERIAEGAYLLYGEGFCSNIYVLLDEGRALLIDSGSGSSIPRLDLLSDYQIDRVLLTHGHADHINGMNYISADGYLHKYDRDALGNLNSFIRNYSPPNNIDELDFERYRFGRFDLEIIHTPGHTQGSISILERTEGLLFTGDTLFAGGDVGRTDLYGGSKAMLRESIKKLQALKFRKLCPGHGQPELVSHGLPVI